jgi:hypothetical protein
MLIELKRDIADGYIYRQGPYEVGIGHGIRLCLAPYHNDPLDNIFINLLFNEHGQIDQTLFAGILGDRDNRDGWHLCVWTYYVWHFLFN